MRKILASKICAGCTFALLMATLGYGQNPPATNPQNSPANSSPAARANTNTSTSDSFLSQAIEINQAEMELGRLASSKAADKRVKSFADMMVKDHTGGLKKLQN